MRTGFWLLLPFALILGARGIEAQEREEEDPILTGRVIDATTGTALVGAFVHLDGERWGVLTDDEGRFHLPKISWGLNSFAVEQLGYVDLVQTTIVEKGGDPVLLALEPDPVLLEGIQIVTDRFERRRRAVAVASQAFTREDLLQAPAFDLLDFIKTRSLLWTVPCGGYSIEGLCAYIRGRKRTVSVYLDEIPFLGGLDLLTTMMPHELHRMEVYRSGAHIRLYTEQFMKRAGKTRLTPMAVFW